MYQDNFEGIPQLTSYASALAHFAQVKPIRGSYVRPLGKRSHHHTKQIHQRSDGSIACRLWSTDVVIWHPDNSLSLTPYGSNSTDSFAGCVLGWGSGFPQAMFAQGDYVRCGDCVYRLSQETRFEQTENSWAPVTDTAPIKHYTINRKRAREALTKHKYPDFRDWYYAIMAHGVEIPQRDHSVGWSVESLQNSENWPSTVAWFSYGNVLDKVREAIYRHESAVDVTATMCVPAQDLEKVRRSQRLQYLKQT